MMNFNIIKSISNHIDFLKKIGFTLFIMIVYRIGSFIPVIGINMYQLREYMAGSSVAGGFLNFIDLFSGGGLSQGTIFALGIGPAITASIFMQFAGFSIPYIQMLNKEGEYGRSIINRYVRYIAFGLSIVYSFGYSFYLESLSEGIIFNPGWGFRFMFVASLVAGCMFVMWLGDQIKVIGIGNGSSMIIFAGIVAKFHQYFFKTIEVVKNGTLSFYLALFILIIFLVLMMLTIFLEKGDRKVNIHYARRIVENKVFGGQNSYIPFKINTVGVMPVIFANSFLNMPIFLIKALSKYAIFAYLSSWLDVSGAIYNILLFGLIMFFTYVYTALLFDPNDLADNLKKSGGFLPGIRPGNQTSDFFSYLLVRIGFVGAIYLASLAVVPNIIFYFIPNIPFKLQGTSLLIVIGVALDFITQVRAHMLEHRYDSFVPANKY